MAYNGSFRVNVNALDAHRNLRLQEISLAEQLEGELRELSYSGDSRVYVLRRKAEKLAAYFRYMNGVLNELQDDTVQMQRQTRSLVDKGCEQLEAALQKEFIIEL